jgi:hypothetical protein
MKIKMFNVELFVCLLAKILDGLSVVGKVYRGFHTAGRRFFFACSRRKNEQFSKNKNMGTTHQLISNKRYNHLKCLGFGGRYHMRTLVALVRVCGRKANIIPTISV